MLTQETFAKAADVLQAPTEVFSDLARIAGLDPATAFRGADLQRIDLRGSDVTGYDLSGCDLTDAQWEGATGLESLVVDGGTTMPDGFREAIRAAREAAEEAKVAPPSR